MNRSSNLLEKVKNWWRKESDIQYYAPGIREEPREHAFWREFNERLSKVSDMKGHIDLSNWTTSERAPTFEDWGKALEMLNQQMDGWVRRDPETEAVSYTVPWDAESPDESPDWYERFKDS